MPCVHYPLKWWISMANLPKDFFTFFIFDSEFFGKSRDFRKKNRFEVDFRLILEMVRVRTVQIVQNDFIRTDTMPKSGEL